MGGSTSTCVHLIACHNATFSGAVIMRWDLRFLMAELSIRDQEGSLSEEGANGRHKFGLVLHTSFHNTESQGI
jgi:hypothetical protein